LAKRNSQKKGDFYNNLINDISKIDWKDAVDDADESQEKRQLSEKV